ncbi:MAG: NAD(P)H-hydrate dehydratase [Flavobacteriales bacterium]|nr:NAD(P)H-hydrate dehydratase [Flavobacteriales bacterium]
MRPVLTSDDLRKADAWTIANEPITSLALMERAATACTGRILEYFASHPDGKPPIVVFAGMGNNGGDGLVIARQLKAAGFPVRAVRVKHRATASADNETNWRAAQEAGVPCSEIDTAPDGAWVNDGELVVDALFGTGLRGPLTGLAADVVRAINDSHAPVIAIDLPSGLVAEDNADNDPAAIVQARSTLTLQVPKLALLLADNARYVGEWEVVPIGLDEEFIAKIPALYHVIEAADIAALLPSRERFAHKGTFGHAMLITGSTGKMGAAVLSTRAATRSGAGLVTVHVPADGLSILQSAAPEAMGSADLDPDRITALPVLEGMTAIGIGPGLGAAEDSQQVVKKVLQFAVCPIVVDADGLNAIAANPTWGAFLPSGTILTPHPKEFDRLAGTPSTSSYDRLQRCRELAQRWRCHIVLKGAWTAICDPNGKVFFNPTGNPGMAKGGSGDALTGLLTGLLAQGLDPLRACLVGVYVHGLAGDLAAERQGMDGMTVSDLIESLPAAWQQLRDL